MVRGNWQRRVERTEARRAASKLQQQRRRNKRRSNSIGCDGDRETSFRRLEDWLEDKGGGLLKAYGDIAVDVWTDVRPEGRKEYQPVNLVDERVTYDEYDEDEGKAKGRSKKQQKEKDRGGFQKIGKTHPNAKNKSDKQPSTQASASNSKGSFANPTLCAQEFYFGREKCPAQLHFKQKRGGGRSRSNSIGDEDTNTCPCQHYHQFPKAKSGDKSKHSTPLTLAQVASGKYSPHPNQVDGNMKPVSLPVLVRDVTLQRAFDAATMPPSPADGDETEGGHNEGTKSKQTSLDMMYHSRVYVEGESSGLEGGINEKGGDDSSEESANTESDEGVNSSEDEEEEESDSNKLLEILQQILDDESLSPTMVVYLTIQGVLVYDSFRGGLIISDAEERYLLSGDDFEMNEIAIYQSNEDASGNSASLNIHEQLTHHILDEILAYLPDESTGALSQVCSAWRDEVGKRSPQLWKMLLGRHGWPGVTVADAAGDGGGDESQAINECRQCREAFVSHYSAVRDVRSIVNACNYLYNGNIVGGKASQNNNSKQGLEYALQVFKATKGSPVMDENEALRCSVKVWPIHKYSTKVYARALSGHPNDCTLRLYEAVQSNPGGTSQNHINRIICRQIARIRAAPSSFSRKKNTCELSDMDLDDDVVACLIEESKEDVSSSGAFGATETRGQSVPWMTVIPREDFVCAGNEGVLDDDCIQSIDLRASILDFIMGSVDDTASYDELRGPLHEYLAVADGDTSDVTISITSKLVALGKGFFLFHAFIAIPQYSLLHPDVEGDDDEAAVDDRLQSLVAMVASSSGDRLFLCSTRRGGAIVHSVSLDTHPGCIGLFASHPFTQRDNTTSAASLCTNVVVQGRNTILLVSLRIDRNGRVDAFKRCLIEDNQIKMKIVVTPSHVIFGAEEGRECILYVHEVHPFDENLNDDLAKPWFEWIEEKESKLYNLAVVQDHYVIAITGTRSSPANDENEDEQFDGHWFGDDDAASTSAVVYHIPSRKQIYRCPLPNEAISLDAFGDTLAINMSSLGFVIAGGCARDIARTSVGERDDVATLTSPSGKNPKSKKKRLASLTAKKDKKDGFARGMSLRG
jgi:hypothetical protein